MRQHNGTILFTSFIILILGLYLLSRVAFDTSSEYVPIKVSTGSLSEQTSPDEPSIQIPAKVVPKKPEPPLKISNPKNDINTPNKKENVQNQKNRKRNDNEANEEEIINRSAIELNESVNGQ